MERCTCRALLEFLDATILLWCIELSNASFSVVWRHRPFSFFYLWAGKEKWSGVSSTMDLCTQLSNGHDSIIRELKSTASKSLVASLSESTGQNYKHITIQKFQTLTLESPSPINKLLSMHWHQNISGCASHEILYCT